MTSVDDFELLREVGRGSQGYVLKAIDQRTGDDVVLKFIEVPEDEEEKNWLWNRVQEEAGILELLGRHKNIVKFKGLFEDDIGNNFVMVFEHLEGELHREALIDEPEQVKNVMRQVLRALAYCHKKGVIHLDIKPSNIMLSESGRAKLIDFGIATQLSEDGFYEFTSIGTTAYMAPELLARKLTYGTAVDVWSAGCVLAELLLGSKLFSGACRCSETAIADGEACPCMDDTLRCITEFCEEPDAPACWEDDESRCSKLKEHLMSKIVDSEAVDLITKMLVLDPEKRITAEEALKSPYFKYKALY